MTIKSIETEYKGYKFRSRVEARWAVFLDHMEIDFQYEPQGFQLSNGQNYLPDFYLPDLDVWVEVKGSPMLDEFEFEKVRHLCKDTKKPVIILKGDPSLKSYTALIYDEEVNGNVNTVSINMLEDKESSTGFLESFHLFKEDEYKAYGEEGIKAIEATKASRGERFGVFEPKYKSLF